MSNPYEINNFPQENLQPNQLIEWYISQIATKFPELLGTGNIEKVLLETQVIADKQDWQIWQIKGIVNTIVPKKLQDKLDALKTPASQPQAVEKNEDNLVETISLSDEQR